MPEAVIVATARSPIGRAFKGTMTGVRADDLVIQMITAALAKVPQLDPAQVEDVILGCGVPGGEQGYNMARVLAVMLGLDGVPGTTITRYCSSSLQSTRMAYHAIKSGEGDVFISAGVEMVSRFGKGSSDGAPDTKNPAFADAEARAAGQTTAHDQVLDLRGIELGHLGQRRLDHLDEQLIGADAGHGSLECPPDRRARGGDDNCLRHGGSLARR